MLWARHILRLHILHCQSSIASISPLLHRLYENDFGRVIGKILCVPHNIEFAFLEEFPDKPPVTMEGSQFLQVGLGIILQCICRCSHHYFCCSKVLPISVSGHWLRFSIEGQGICFHPQINVLLLDQMLVQEGSFLFCRPSQFG